MMHVEGLTPVMIDFDALGLGDGFPFKLPAVSLQFHVVQLSLVHPI